MKQHLTEQQKGIFGPEILQLMAGALNDAWQSLRHADTTLADATKRAMAREQLARRIIELATEGERDQQRLREGALAAIKAEANSVAPRPKRALPTHVLTALIVAAIATIMWLAAAWGTVGILG